MCNEFYTLTVKNSYLEWMAVDAKSEGVNVHCIVFVWAVEKVCTL